MNILYINHYAGTPLYGMEFRPYYLSQEWIKKGHKVRILAANFSHVRSCQPKTETLPKQGKAFVELIDNIEYFWYNTPHYNGNGVARVKNIWAFCRQVWQDINNIIQSFQPDIVICSSTYPMDIWLGSHIVKQTRKTGKKCKLVFEIHDLWPLSPIELGGMSRKHPFIMLCQAAENFACKNADVVVSMLPNVGEHLKEHGLDLNKLTIIPNGVVEKDWQPENISPISGSLKHFLISQKNQNKTIVGYAGSHGNPNALEYLLDAAKLLKNKPISFVLVGGGLEKENLIKKAKDEAIDNIYFFDPIVKTQIPDLLRHFDIAYIGWRQVPIYRFGISPNKLTDYMMAECPILHSVKAGNDLVYDAGCGLTVEPENPQEIANGIMQLFRLPANELQKMGKQGKAYILKNQTYTVLAEQFLNAIIH